MLLHVYDNLRHESGVQQLVQSHSRTFNVDFINVAIVILNMNNMWVC